MGLDDGDTDGPLLGLDDGDWLGVDVGCEMRMELNSKCLCVI